MRKDLTLLALPMLACVVAACNFPATATPKALVGTIAASTKSPAPPPTAQASGQCDYDYFPTEEGTTWEYAGTNVGTGDYHRTVTITDSRDDGFSLTSQLSSSDVTLTLEYACTEAGLIMLDPTGGIVTGAASGPKGAAVMKTLDHSGITLPSEPQAGQTWQQYIQWEASSSDVTLHGEYNLDYTAMGLETITVPLGTFDAMRVEAELHGTLEGQSVGTCQISSWFAKDVGLIKQDFVCDFLGLKIDNSVQLEEFDSP